MLDTLFWIAVVVASLCGTLMICIDLYEEWADEAHNVDNLTGETPTAQIRRLAAGIENAPSGLGQAI